MSKERPYPNEYPGQEPERGLPVPNPAERASEYITISVAEYHFLTKAATVLEAIMNCQSYHRDGLVAAARKILTIEAGAKK